MMKIINKATILFALSLTVACAPNNDQEVANGGKNRLPILQKNKTLDEKTIDEMLENTIEEASGKVLTAVNTLVDERYTEENPEEDVYIDANIELTEKQKEELLNEKPENLNCEVGVPGDLQIEDMEVSDTELEEMEVGFNKDVKPLSIIQKLAEAKRATREYTISCVKENAEKGEASEIVVDVHFEMTYTKVLVSQVNEKAYKDKLDALKTDEEKEKYTNSLEINNVIQSTSAIKSIFSTESGNKFKGLNNELFIEQMEEGVLKSYKKPSHYISKPSKELWSKENKGRNKVPGKENKTRNKVID